MLHYSTAIITTTTGQIIKMKLELAKTDKEQETGLMGRLSVPEDSGMLFIYKDKALIPFWMKNTAIPLSIAWIDEIGRILEIQDMEVFSDKLYYPTQPYLWALEVPQGYFTEKGIQPGSTVHLYNN